MGEAERASAHVNNATLPSKFTRLANAVNVVFMISAYEAMTQ